MKRKCASCSQYQSEDSCVRLRKRASPARSACATSSLLASRLPATLTVMVPILVLDALLAIPFALAVAAVRGSLTDRAIMVVTTVALSISFLVYVIVGQWLFAFQLGWFPTKGFDWDSLTWGARLHHTIVPLACEMVGAFTALTLFTRIPFAQAEELLGVMWACVQIIPDPGNPSVIRSLVEDDIEEVATRLRLRSEIIKMHLGFSQAAGK